MEIGRNRNSLGGEGKGRKKGGIGTGNVGEGGRGIKKGRDRNSVGEGGRLAIVKEAR